LRQITGRNLTGEKISLMLEGNSCIKAMWALWGVHPICRSPLPAGFLPNDRRERVNGTERGDARGSSFPAVCCNLVPQHCPFLQTAWKSPRPRI